MELDCAIEAQWPDATDWSALAEDVAGAVGRVVPALGNPRLCASVLFSADSELHRLNREWRGKDKPTNVLSFPMLDGQELAALASEGPPVMLGDIALSLETCRREAAEKSVPLEDHAAHLVIHGLLHLAGHDHELGDAEAEEMEGLEIKALAILGIKDPYGPST